MKRYLLFLTLLLLLPLSAFAHDVSMEAVTVIINRKGVLVSVVLPKNDQQGVPTEGEIRAHIGLTQGGKPVAYGKGNFRIDSTKVTWQAPLKAGTGDYALSRTFPTKAVLIVFQEGKVKSETVYEATDAQTPSLSAPASSLWSGQLLLSYGKLGVEHLATGLDHILFVVALVLAGGLLRRIVKIITCFTLAHSITLGVAALGVFSLSPRLVEPLIALSIAVVAIETIRRKPESKDIRPYLAFGFGLIHGFGFAGGILEKGFPQEAVAPALLGFNIGLEIAQIVVAIVALSVLSLIAKLQPLKLPRVRVGVAYGLSLIALFWFVQRLVA